MTRRWVDCLRVEREVDGRWFAEVRVLPGALAYGATREDAQARVLRLTHRVLRRGHPAFRLPETATAEEPV
jgi:hypothetical protein